MVSSPFLRQCNPFVSLRNRKILTPLFKQNLNNEDNCQKMRNGIGIRIPKELLKYLNINDGTKLVISREEGQLTLKPEHSVMNIDDLVRGMDQDNPHQINMDSELGNEIIEGWNISSLKNLNRIKNRSAFP